MISKGKITVAADRSVVGAIYKGLAIGQVTINGELQTLLYAVDNSANRRIDVFNGNFNLVQLSPRRLW